MKLKRIEEVIATSTPYYISDSGLVFKGNLDSLSEVSLTIHNKKYELKIQYEGSIKIQVLFVHKLVAKYFLDNPFKFTNVLHKDRNKLNNKVENLMWNNHTSLPGCFFTTDRAGTQSRENRKGIPVKDFDGEVWKICQRFNNIQVSNKGRVKKGNWLYRQRGSNETYKIVTIQNKGYKIHRLVAETFLELPSKEHTQVNHIDGIKSNNDLSNLEWVTPSQNCIDKNVRNKNVKRDWIKLYIERSKISEHELIEQKWKQVPIIGFENFYVSNLGIVKKKELKNGVLIEKYISPTLLSSANYFECRLTVGNRRAGRLKYKEFRRSIHTLVALAWIPNLESKYSVNHKDCNTYNNRVENLEWATAHEQNKHYRSIKHNKINNL